MYASDHAPPIHVRIKRRAFGDLRIFRGLITSPLYTMLLFERKKAYARSLTLWTEFTINCIASCMNYVFRYGHSFHTCGIVMALSCLSFIVSFNSADPYMSWIPYYILFRITHPFFENPGIDFTGSEAFDILIVNVHSKILVYYAAVFLALSFIHIILSYAGVGGNSTARGKSYIHTLLTWMVTRLSHGIKTHFPTSPFARWKKRVPSEFFITGMVEPLLVASAGFSAWHYLNDWYVFVFSLMISGCEFVLQLRDKAALVEKQGILEA